MRSRYMVAKLKDVAQLAGVSVTTVSRVINNYGSLSEKTINKVHKAMRELNYQPNALARAMQGKPSKFIGLIFPNIINPFYAELVNELEYQLFAKGYKTIIASSAQNREIEHDYLAMLMANQVDGIISGSHNLGIEEYQRIKSPIVSFDRYLADNIPIVSANSYRGGQLAAEYLIDRQVKQVAILIDEDTSVSPTINRVQGAVDCFTRHQIDYEPLDAKTTDLAATFPGKYDGVIATNDLDALKIMHLAAKAGKKVNHDFHVTGYDGAKMILELEPELPTVQQPTAELAKLLIDTLLKRIKNPELKFQPQQLAVTFHRPLSIK